MVSKVTIGLSLNSPEWKKLVHAYGSSESTLDLLAKLKTFADDYAADPRVAESDEAEALLGKMLDEFGSNLFHQQTTYDATIAAVPHFIEIAKRLPPKFKQSILIDVAWIQRAGGFIHAQSLPDLRDWYDQAIKDCVPLIDEWLEGPAPGEIWQEMDMLRSALSVRNVDELFLADAVHWFEECWFKCPECSVELYACWIEQHRRFDIWETKLGFVHSRVEPDLRCSVEPNLDKPDQRLGDRLSQAAFELMLDLVSRAPAREAETWVRSFYGEGKCRSCQATLCLGQIATEFYKAKREKR